MKHDEARRSREIYQFSHGLEQPPGHTLPSSTEILRPEPLQVHPESFIKLQAIGRLLHSWEGTLHLFKPGGCHNVTGSAAEGRNNGEQAGPPTTIHI